MELESSPYPSSPIDLSKIKFVKRDGSTVPYDPSKIAEAVKKAFINANDRSKRPEIIIDQISKNVGDKATSAIWSNLLSYPSSSERGFSITLDECQELVEDILIKIDPYVAKSYIYYRKRRDELRKNIPEAERETIVVSVYPKLITEMKSIKAVLESEDKSFSKEGEIHHRIQNILDQYDIGVVSKKVDDELHLITEETRHFYEESSKYFSDDFQQVIYYRTYSRWIEEEGRRETWIQTVDRYLSFMIENLGPIGNPNSINQEEYDSIREQMLKMGVMPSMRLLQFAGPAARRNNLCAYNCCYVAPKSLIDLRDIMYVLMNGTGVGFSVESKYTSKFPVIKFQPTSKEGEGQSSSSSSRPTFKIPDSKEGWCDAFYYGLQAWYEGRDVHFDYSLIRPFGSKLKTMGGTASGPEPLVNLLRFSRKIILGNQGRQLTPIMIHDLICHIAQTVVVGSVRRSALISLSDLEDKDMRDAKQGEFWKTDLHRCQANNSAVYSSKPSDEVLMDEWNSLIKSRSGERGIFSRSHLIYQLPKRRIELLGEEGVQDLGTNPCGEILLQDGGLCNLSTAVCRPGDTEEDLKRKVRIATIIGTYQSTLTKFGYVSDKFKTKAEMERLLGISLAGQQDCSAVRNERVLSELKELVIKTNIEYALRFGINPSSCTTCTKPDGTLGLVVKASCGVHAAYDDYYIRRVRFSSSDPLAKLLKDHGVPCFPEVGFTWENATSWVFEFPQKAPEGSVKRYQMTAIDSLEYWKMVKVNYTEHNPSVTINVKKDEWIDVLKWLKENWEYVGGLSFLPYDDHVYELAPYESITEKEYERRMSFFPKKIHFEKLVYYEKKDMTDVKSELACVGGACAL